jgi:hypothetical protein
MEAGFKNPGHAGVVARHFSVEALDTAPGFEVRKENAISGDLSEAEKM